MEAGPKVTISSEAGQSDLGAMRTPSGTWPRARFQSREA